MLDKTPNVTKLEDMIEKKTDEMYENVGSVQEELGEIEIEGRSDKNLVKIILTGQHFIKKLSIDPGLLKESNKTVEDHIITAYNNAKTEVEKKVKQKMEVIAREMGLYQKTDNE